MRAKNFLRALKIEEFGKMKIIKTEPKRAQGGTEELHKNNTVKFSVNSAKAFIIGA